VFTEQKAGMDRWWSACSVMSCSGAFFIALLSPLFSPPGPSTQSSSRLVPYFIFSGNFLFVGCVMAVLVRAYLHVDLEESWAITHTYVVNTRISTPLFPVVGPSELVFANRCNQYLTFSVYFDGILIHRDVSAP
jgi:hypothetical protein